MKKTIIWGIVMLLGAILAGIGYGISWNIAYNKGYDKATNEAKDWVVCRYQEWEDEKQIEKDELIYNIEGYVNGEIYRGRETNFNLNNDNYITYFEKGVWEPEDED